jgi:hypothetical protein
MIAVCSQIHKRYINTLCGQNVELLNVKLVVLKLTTEVLKVNLCIPYHPLVDFTPNHYHQKREEVGKRDGIYCPALTMHFIPTHGPMYCPALTMHFIPTHGLIKSAATVTFYDYSHKRSTPLRPDYKNCIAFDILLVTCRDDNGGGRAAGVTVTFQNYIREVPDSNLGWDAGYLNLHFLYSLHSFLSNVGDVVHYSRTVSFHIL